MDKSIKSFEEAMNELEGIVEALERGDMPLDKSIDMFQKGIELSKYCSKCLDKIEKKITLLVENEKGELTEEEFNLKG